MEADLLSIFAAFLSSFASCFSPFLGRKDSF